MAVGLLERGLDSLPGSSGRNLLTADFAFSVATAIIYGSKWQVLVRSGGVTTRTDTGVLVNAYRRVRIEMVKDSSLGGPRTNVYIDGINVYTSTTIPVGPLAFGTVQQPISVASGNGSGMELSPVRITALYTNV